MSIVKVEDFTFTYPGNDEPTLKNISLTIEPGEVVGLIGPVGAGKTTLCMAIAGFVPSVTGGDTSGEIEIDGDSQASANGASEDMNRQVGMVFEDYAAQIVQLQVLEEVVTPLRDRGLSPEEANDRARELLEKVRLGEQNLEKRRVWELSGGQQLRLALAAVLAIDPPIFIFDNILDKLDPQEQELVIQLVRDLAGDKTLIIVEQNITLLQQLAEQFLVLVDGEVVEEGKADDILGNPELLARADTLPPLPLRIARDLDLSESPLTFEAFEQAIANRHQDDRNGETERQPVAEQEFNYQFVEIRNNRMLANGDEQLQPLRQPQEDSSAGDRHFSEPVIRIQDVTFCYDKKDDGSKALENVNITVREGEVHGVIGRSGAGKTTLIQLLAGLLHPTEGKIYIGDSETGEKNVCDLAMMVGTVLQRPDDHLSEKTVRDEIVFPLKQRQQRSGRYDNDYIERRRSQVCELVGIDENLFDRDPFLLPQGQRQLIAIAEVLSVDPSVLLIDEPAVGIGKTARQKINQAIAHLCDQGKAVLIAGNDIDFITNTADTVTILEQGRTVLQGTVNEVFAPENWDQLSELHLQPPSVARLSQQVGVNAVKYDELVSKLS